jgi:hypothetical protein
MLWCLGLGSTSQAFVWTRKASCFCLPRFTLCLICLASFAYAYAYIHQPEQISLTASAQVLIVSITTQEGKKKKFHVITGLGVLKGNYI